MSPLIPISAGDRAGAKFLTIDNQLRLCFSSALRKELRLDTGLDWVVLAVDPENKRIGVVRQDLAKAKNVNAFKVDKRGYTSGRMIIDKMALKGAEFPLRFIDGGFEDSDGVRYRVFELKTDD
jgi:hypothetical protein